MGVIQLGDFTLVEPIAQGGIGQVWRGVHRSGAPVAVKVLTADGLTRPVWVESLNAEIRAVAGLDHPHIVWIHDAGVVDAAQAAPSEGLLTEGCPWFAMELADGGTLREHKQLAGWDALRDLLVALLDALAHAHAHGIVHRDIKPANVLFSGGVPKLSDFGMVFTTDPNNPIVPIGGGTPSYMAPEQFEGRAADLGPWTDLYALGCLAYTLASGHRPFRGNQWVRLYDAHLHQRVPPLIPKFDVPTGFEDWLRALLAKSRHQRFQRAADARWALLALEEYSTLPPIEEGYATDPTEVTHTVGRSELPRYPRPPLPGPIDAPAAERPRLGAGLGLYGLRALPFVGRIEERTRLWEALEQVERDGRCQAVVLRGPAGVGKSRLAEWLCRRAHEVGAAEVFRTTHGPLPGALDGIPGLLARALRAWDAPDHDTLLQVVDAELQPRGLRDPWVHAALVELLQPQGDGPRLMSTRRRHELVVRVLACLAGRRPSVIWFDDVQWGPDAIDLCDHLLTATHAPPCLLLLTAREEALVDEPDAASALDDLLDHGAALQLELAPLDRSASIALITQGLGLDPQLAARMHQRIAGNPMFAVELVGDWVERGLMVPGPAGFQLTNADALRTPTSVGAIWDGRLNALFRADPQFRVPLQVAAALGIEVDLVEWQRACASAGSPAPAALWRKLQDLRLVRRDPATPRYAFVHGMLRETILDGARRDGDLERVHAAIASSLDDPARAGLHLLEAGEVELAGERLLEAARQAAGTDLRAAIRLLQLRDEALEDRDADDPARVEGWLLGSEVCRLGAHPDDGARWARTALHWATVRRNRPLTVRALQASASCARMTGDLVHARHHVDSAMRLSEGLEASIRAATLFECGATLLDSGDLVGAERAVRRALELYVDVEPRIRAAAMLGYLLAQRGETPEARRMLLEVLPEARASGNRLRLADLHNALGEVERASGHLDDAAGHYRLAQQTLEGTGITEPVYRANLALVLLARGEIAEARELMAEVAREAEQIGARMLVLLAHAGLAACASDRRSWREMRQHLIALRDDGGGLVAEDIARCLRYAGTHAMAMDETHLGRMALELAAVQYRALGDHGSAEHALGLARS